MKDHRTKEDLVAELERTRESLAKAVRIKVRSVPGLPGKEHLHGVAETLVTAVMPDGSEVDLSELVIRASWIHDPGEGVSRLQLELIDAEVQLSGKPDVAVQASFKGSADGKVVAIPDKRIGSSVPEPASGPTPLAELIWRSLPPERDYDCMDLFNLVKGALGVADGSLREPTPAERRLVRLTLDRMIANFGDADRKAYASHVQEVMAAKQVHPVCSNCHDWHRTEECWRPGARMSKPDAVPPSAIATDGPHGHKGPLFCNICRQRIVAGQHGPEGHVDGCMNGPNPGLRPPPKDGGGGWLGSVVKHFLASQGGEAPPEPVRTAEDDRRRVANRWLHERWLDRVIKAAILTRFAPDDRRRFAELYGLPDYGDPRARPLLPSHDAATMGALTSQAPGPAPIWDRGLVDPSKRF